MSSSGWRWGWVTLHDDDDDDDDDDEEEAGCTRAYAQPDGAGGREKGIISGFLTLGISNHR